MFSLSPACGFMTFRVSVERVNVPFHGPGSTEQPSGTEIEKFQSVMIVLFILLEMTPSYWAPVLSGSASSTQCLSAFRAKVMHTFSEILLVEYGLSITRVFSGSVSPFRETIRRTKRSPPRHTERVCQK